MRSPRSIGIAGTLALALCCLLQPQVSSGHGLLQTAFATAATHLRAMQLRVITSGAGAKDVNGVFQQRDAAVIPSGFAKTCREMRWNTEQMWLKLSDHQKPWFELPNGSYLYWNRADGCWWLDGPSGAGLYIAKSDDAQPPESGWKPLVGVPVPPPKVRIQPVKAHAAPHHAHPAPHDPKPAH